MKNATDCHCEEEKAGIEIIEGNKSDVDLMQIVCVLSYKMNSDEALAIIGTQAGDPTCLFEAPASIDDDELRLYVYSLDFSHRYHGNPTMTDLIDKDAWGLRLTPYATSHGATWSNRLMNLSPEERKDFFLH